MVDYCRLKFILRVKLVVLVVEPDDEAPTFPVPSLGPDLAAIWVCTRKLSRGVIWGC